MRSTRLKLRKITSFIFSFLLTLLIYIFLVNLGLCYGLFSDNCVISTLNETNYYDKVYEELHFKVKELLDGCNMPLDLFDDVINQRRLYMASNTYISKSLQKETPQINTDRLIAELHEKLDRYYAELGIEQTEDILAKTQGLITEVEKEYNKRVRFPVVDIIMKIRREYAGLLLYIYPLVLILAAVIIVCLLKLYRRKHRSMRYINYAMLAASLLLIASCAGLILNKAYEWFNFMPGYYRDFLVVYCRLNIQACLYTGVLSLLISAVFVAFTAYMRNQYYSK